MTIQAALIDYFKKGLVAKDKTVDFAELNKRAVKLGYIISPECCNEYVKDWLDSLTANHNATFYKEWNDVISKSRFELFIDQIHHYATTYGKDHEIEGNGFVPNDGGICPRFEDLKVIEPITEEELAGKCFGVLESGIALKDSTMKVLCDFWYSVKVENVDWDWKKSHLADVLSLVKNKEAMVYLSKKIGILPSDVFGMLRCIASAYTGKFDLIKSKSTIATIKAKARMSGFRSPLLDLSEKQIEKLSSVFLRYKTIFLAMKCEGRKVCSIINRLRRLAEKNHKPFKIGFWEGIIKNEQPIEEVRNRLKDLDNFRKVRLMMLCKERMNFKTENGVYTIRNGKQYVREGYSPKYDRNWIARLYFAIEESLVESLKPKACKVKLPTGYYIALPTSEKNFIGNYPYGTSFEMTKNNVIGIYWRNEWGTHDFDLSVCDIAGNRIAWNSMYRTQCGDKPCFIYSGDMTNADPEAVELMYASGSAPDSVVMVNKFYGKQESKFRFFFANENLDAVRMMNHMVNPNNIKFDMMVDINENQKTIGLCLDNRFYLTDLVTGNNRVSRQGRYVGVVIGEMKKKFKSTIWLNEILLRAGFTVLDVDSDEKPDIDFTNLEKDTLISLLSK